ncbi:Plant invertase/pectin methylesterase inhibitor superfamily protein [Raphanus sativus]|uniref:Invertase inhibitor n=1 Tax=Raphanus sativus TaxID=3726 RepID=A0A6J0K9B5_RAPSA|nr:putative invertase inhibitor [Raphanus sativus]KAJ4885416.1 Plant invertase/pectin methylesterase inhibitor superfamily protein [Raphanus sativus]
MNLSHLLFFFFLLLLVSQVKSTDDMIEETCKTCASKSMIFDYNFCMSSLNSPPMSPPPPLLPTNLSFLALTPMLQALDNATATASIIQQLMSEGGGFEDDDYGRACLRDCLELYEDAAERLEEAVRVFVSREEKETVKVMVSAAMEVATTCETGFMERDGGDGGGAMTWTSPLGVENYKLFELGEIAICIINMISPVTSMSL